MSDVQLPFAHAHLARPQLRQAGMSYINSAHGSAGYSSPLDRSLLHSLDRPAAVALSLVAAE